MMGASYADFLAAKTRAVHQHGHQNITADDVHPLLHPWQRQIVAWAVRTGRAAVWADTGLGKTLMQLEWARLAGGPALVIAPLAVCRQTVREAARIGLSAHYVRDPADVTDGQLTVTNLEMVERFDPSWFDAVVLDESSILKQYDGRTRTMLIDWAARVPMRLSCTATPAPNDPEELTSQAAWLGVMSRVEMLAAYFVHDNSGWRLKGHAAEPMFRWMASWAVALRRPSDLGGDDDGYELPGLNILTHLVSADVPVPDGQLFAADLGGVGGRAKIRKATLDARCARAAELVAAEPDEPWVLWCGLNAEAERLTRTIPGAVDVHGTLSPDEKADRLLAFADGHIRVLVTKPSIAAHGLNWQHCARTAFVGLSDSYETYYQAMRRFHRYGQKRRVHAHVVLSELEGQIASNIARKERTSARTTTALVAAMRRQQQEIR